MNFRGDDDYYYLFGEAITPPQPQSQLVTDAFENYITDSGDNFVTD